ncbi:hypothetical protein AB0Y53_21890 [Parabacteroides distasonis]|uniref:hypothetical protein n=1 Tax=Parabacteroides distasonis TaxID=823 RepID=UPI003F21802C
MIPEGTYLRDSSGLNHYLIEGHIIGVKTDVRGYQTVVWDKELDKMYEQNFHEQSLMNDVKMSKKEIEEFNKKYYEWSWSQDV